jgi:uncharacterized protein YlxP (DUF503 family)
MVVGVLRLELILHAPQNLKEKRGIVRKILDRCRVRFPVSCAETDYQNTWQRSGLGFAMVGRDEGSIHGTFTRIEEEILRTGLAEIGDREVEFLHY